MINIKTALAEARALLQQNNITQPRLDAEILLAHLLTCGRAALYAHSERVLTSQELTRYKQLVQQRADGQPVAYITGKKEFMGLDFTVTPQVLIPRPDTELLVETAVHLAQGIGGSPLMVDVGTGSGAIAVSTAHYVPNLRVLAVDISPQALIAAKQNALAHRVDNRIEFILGNLLTPITGTQPPGTVDIITANLPYVPSSDIPTLAKEVQKEPVLALDGGPDGLDLYRLLIPQAENLLKPGGHLLMEIGPGQGQNTLNLVTKPKWQAKLYHDLADRERLVVAKRV